MMEFIIMTVIVALIASFVLCLMYKWGIVEYVQVHGNEFFSKMFGCNFCMSWWICVIISIFVALICCKIVYLTIPILAVNITKKLI